MSDKICHGRRTGEGTTVTVTDGTGSRPLDVADMDADAAGASIAQRTASTTLRNSMIDPSPVRLTMRP
jgi:hypothetical protein